MADPNVPEVEDFAEHNNVVASETEAVIPEAVIPEAVPPEAGSPVAATEFPAKAKRGRRPRPAIAPATSAQSEQAQAEKIGAVKKSAPRKSVAAKSAAKATISNTKNTRPVSQLKDKTMATIKTPDFTKGIQDAIANAQDKAKVAFEKSASSFGDIGEFTKGNVEALVESGKIFAAGAQGFGSTYVAESRAAFETLTADVKELASTTSPTDFFKLQGDLMRRNFDAAVAVGSKNSEAMLKLVNEAFAPISGRVSLAIDKAKTAA